jgi:hypothetical protein
VSAGTTRTVAANIPSSAAARLIGVAFNVAGRKLRDHDVIAHNVGRTSLSVCGLLYTVARPVEEAMTLVDEAVAVERQPITGIETHSGAFQEWDIEVTERHEEPVVAKTTTADEAVVVRKTTKDRQEKVRDEVRETKVDRMPASAMARRGL